MDAVEVHGLRIAYERTGAGPAARAPARVRRRRPHDVAAPARRPRRRVHRRRLGRAGCRRILRSPETFGLTGYADALAGFVAALGLQRPHVAGLSFGGALALAFAHRHPAVPATLILASAYAGWGGSLPPDEAERRLRQAFELARLSPAEFADALLPTMFAPGTSASAVAAFGAAVRRFHPAGFRAMARASAEDLREVLPHVRIPALLLYGERDVRAPLGGGRAPAVGAPRRHARDAAGARAMSRPSRRRSRSTPRCAASSRITLPRLQPANDDFRSTARS